MLLVASCCLLSSGLLLLLLLFWCAQRMAGKVCCAMLQGVFNGCGGATAEHVTRLSFSNQDSTQQEACIDDVRLSA